MVTGDYASSWFRGRAPEIKGSRERFLGEGRGRAFGNESELTN
jgi:hypothetical protein